MPPALLPSTAVVYAGPGAGSRSIVSAVESLRRALKPSLLVDTLTTDQLLQGEWTQGCRLLVMPGGADLPYCRHLNGAGNKIITNFVENQGGAYLGLCAGAYYACSRVEFEVGSEIEVVGDRELGFYPGITSGSIYPGFDYQSENGAIAAPIKFKASNSSVFHNSGDDGTNMSGDDGAWMECRDYLNGGPGFLEPDSPSKFLSLCSCLPPNIEILATFSEHNNAAAAIACQIGLGRAVLCSTHPELTPEWLALPSGAGRSDAVLSSVDLENSNYKNQTSGSGGGADSIMNTTSGTSDVAAVNEKNGHVERLRTELEKHQQGRWQYWKRLLIAAGLEDALVEC